MLIFIPAIVNVLRAAAKRREAEAQVARRRDAERKDEKRRRDERAAQRRRDAAKRAAIRRQDHTFSTPAESRPAERVEA